MNPTKGVSKLHGMRLKRATEGSACHHRFLFAPLVKLESRYSGAGAILVPFVARCAADSDCAFELSVSKDWKTTCPQIWSPHCHHKPGSWKRMEFV
jgi:hypothetical protein